jgi:hypothetical protein
LFSFFISNDWRLEVRTIRRIANGKVAISDLFTRLKQLDWRLMILDFRLKTHRARLESEICNLKSKIRTSSTDTESCALLCAYPRR